ncbi:aminomethyl-transferring glycine dehydrogenase subunit GcvPA [candidate division KSB1 bacterium]|nr:aminomethyl-transferring glycine dehydrogenase subunit GcvPA [candidate division KSB1 bacterium]
MPFLSNSPEDQKAMLKAIGAEDFQALLNNIPSDLLLDKKLDLPAPLSEFEAFQHLRKLSLENKNTQDLVCFLGAGAYDHYVPAAVNHILARSEFYTAYTPYQAEVSQGTLQAIYEFQTMICELTGMDVSNASLYDAGSALAEAVLLAHSQKKRNKIFVSSTVHPYYTDIIRTYCHGQGIEINLIPAENGITDLNHLKDHMDDQIAAMVMQHPNFFGCLEDMEKASEIVHEQGGLFVTSNDPISLALLKPPGAYGADIATGEGQVLGNALNFGGPFLGIFTATRQLVRRIPGRIVGETVDQDGRRGFVLTLQTREQHIRREKATSNICTNQGLNALAATLYLSLMGKSGLEQAANHCLQKSHYLAKKIGALDGFSLEFDQPFFKEFVVHSDIPVKKILRTCEKNGILAGIELAPFFPHMENCFLCAVTEKRNRKELDALVDILKTIR